MKRKVSVEEKESQGSEFFQGLRAGFPILIGYVPIALAFGLLAQNTGLDFFHTAGMSLLVFAGAAQFMSLNLINLGISSWQIIVATFLLNFRHFFMSASLSQRLKKTSFFLLPILSFGVTDETFSVASANKGKISSLYLLGLEIMAYGSWVIGSCIGFSVGRTFPPDLQIALGTALYGLFAILLVPYIKKGSKYLILALLAGMVNTFGQNVIEMNPGWSFVVGISTASLVGVIFNFNNGRRA